MTEFGIRWVMTSNWQLTECCQRDLSHRDPSAVHSQAACVLFISLRGNLCPLLLFFISTTTISAHALRHLQNKYLSSGHLCRKRDKNWGRGRLTGKEKKCDQYITKGENEREPHSKKLRNKMVEKKTDVNTPTHAMIQKGWEEYWFLLY